MSQVGLTESVRGDPRRFEVWLNGRAEVHTFQAATVEIKGKWVSEIKKVLFNQLEELKDEKIKQYGNANHRWAKKDFVMCQVVDNNNITFHWIDFRRPLKQSNSINYDNVPVTTTSLHPQRSSSVDHGNNDKHGNDWHSTGISASSSEHDNQETNAWSSDYSNSEDEFTILEENAVPVSLATTQLGNIIF